MRLKVLAVCVVAFMFVILTRSLCICFILLASIFSGVYYLKINTVIIENSEESMEMIIFRKRIQAINWKIMYNRIAYLIQIHKIMKHREMRSMQKHKHEVQSKKRKGVIEWSSWCDKEEESKVPNKIGRSASI